MNFEPKTRQRRSTRLRNYDYSQPGAYFLTLCVWDRGSLFGEIVDGAMRPNAIGHIVAEEWVRTATIRSEIELDAWVVMPNHLHGILVISDPGMSVNIRTGSSQHIVGATGGRPSQCTGEPLKCTGEPLKCTGEPLKCTGERPLAPTHRSPVAASMRPRSLGAAVAGFKSASTRRINEWRRTPGEKVWLRNYWERVIRDDAERWHIQEYIRSNPARWLQDKLNPSAP